MNRREFLVGGAALAGCGAAAGFALGCDYAQGCIDDPVAHAAFIARRRRPYFHQYPAVRGTGRRTRTFLWKAYEKVVGQPFVPAKQALGDCTGQTLATAADTLTAVQIALLKRPEEWRARSASEPFYAGGRVEIGHYPLTHALFDGCPLEYVVDFAVKYGVLLRQKYGDIDLTTYRPDLAKAWGMPGVGVPDALEPIAKLHPIKTASLVHNFDEMADAIANGYPVALGFHNCGFKFETDHDGFAIPTYRRTKRWAHAVTAVGVDSVSRRRGACLSNHWGTDWLQGPVHRLGVIPGGFWVDAHLIDRMIAQNGTAIALSNYVGYPRRSVEYQLW